MSDPFKSDVPVFLSTALREIIPKADLIKQQLFELEIWLWLISPAISTVKLNQEVMQKIWENTPYWIFCWASGLAMARWLLAEPWHVKDKVVLDFGSGSGVVAIAAKKAGAKRVICCDTDSLSLKACYENAKLNQVDLEYSHGLYTSDRVDVLLAADVLYDQCNRYLLDEFLSFANEIWVADSRIKNFKHDNYFKLGEYTATTWPDLDEAKEFNCVSFYKTL